MKPNLQGSLCVKRQLSVLSGNFLEQRAEFEKTREDEKAAALKPQPSVAAKLPKLSITKFSAIKSRRLAPFWGKFESEIDSSNLAKVTKLGYLKELLEKHLRNYIEGLPFTEDGYNNAKAILEAEYGQPAEIVNVYMKNIMELPVITGANPRNVKTSTSNFATMRKAWIRLSGSEMSKEMCGLL